MGRDADADAIRKAYRKLARQLHPDVNPGDAAAEERFKEVSAAYAVLSDEEKRRNYDEFGDASLEGGFDAEAARKMRDAFGQRFGGPGAGGAPFGFGAGPEGGTAFEFGDLDDLLGRVFGGRGQQPPQGLRGADIEAVLELDFLEAARGGEKRLQLQVPDERGAPKLQTVTVRIPAGVADGGQIRLRGKGAPGLGGGPPGDLLARIRVRPHPVLRREGRDLHVEVPVTVSEAVRGAKVDVPTLDGRATVTVPPGSDGGRRLRLRGKGVPDPSGGPPGDLYVTLRILVPRDLDTEGEAALDRLERFEPRDPREDLFR